MTELCNNSQLFMDRYDYLEIVNDGRMVGKYCGQRSRQNIFLTGDQILMKFHSDDMLDGRGFLIYFNAGPHGEYFSWFLKFGKLQGWRLITVNPPSVPRTLISNLGEDVGAYWRGGVLFFPNRGLTWSFFNTSSTRLQQHRLFRTETMFKSDENYTSFAASLIIHKMVRGKGGACSRGVLFLNFGG